MKIRVGEHFNIMSMRCGGSPKKTKDCPGEYSALYGPHLERFSNGNLFLGFTVDADSYKRKAIFNWITLLSEDNGDTWWVNSLYPFHTGVPFEDTDGMVYLYGNSFGRDYHYPLRYRDYFVTPRYLSYDKGKTWEGPESVYLHIPQAKGIGFNGRKILELSNGNLISTVFCCFRGEEKTRVIAIISTNKGRHWEYFSTVAYDPYIETEGYTESVVLQLPSGKLICIMRTGGYYPLMQSFSNDLGKSWSRPIETGVEGVWPDLCLMKNDIVVCAYGRPACNVMFSLDGQKWTNHIKIVPEHIRSHCYNAVREISPGKLLYVYNIAGYPENNYNKARKNNKPRYNSIKGVFIDISK